MQIGAGFFVGAGIPKGERVNTFVECGCCGAYHRTDFDGDCREDSERHWDLPDDAEVVYLEDDDDELPTCILTGAIGEDPDDCTTHEHES